MNFTMRPNAIPIDVRAHATLRYIRASMEAAASLAIPGSAGTTMGVVGVLAYALASNPRLQPAWLTIWLAAACVAAVLGSAILTRQWGVQGRGLLGAPVRKFLLCMCPSLVAGAVLTSVAALHGQWDAIPGTWLLLYGSALLSASAVTKRVIAVMGALFVLLGAVALMLPASTHNTLLGVGFGGLHLIFGVFLMKRGTHVDQDQ
jgi:hypothetical protein